MGICAGHQRAPNEFVCQISGRGGMTMTRCHGATVSSRRSEWLRGLALLALAITWGSQAIGGQSTSAVSSETDSWTLPRTLAGHPELQGTWFYGTEIPLVRPDELAGKESLTPEEAAEYLELRAAQRRESRGGRPSRYSDEFDDQLAKGNWSERTSLISDPPNGKYPPITPEAEARREARAAAFADATGPEDFGLADRCILGWHSGPPIIPGNQSNFVQLLQTRDHVVIHSELNHDARIVSLNDQSPPEPTIRDYTGISNGRWENDTLVVETTNFTSAGVGNLAFRRQSGGTDQNMHLVERFTRTGPNTLVYEFTVTDLTTWTQPWTASLTMLKTDERIYEYACHEGNYSLITFLSNARAREKEEAAKEAGGDRRPPE